MDALKFYKIPNYLFRKNHIFMSRIVERINFFMYNSYIPSSCQIAENTKIAYGGIGVVIHRNAVIGKNCMIGQGCTIGGKFGSKEVPIIGDNVYIGAGVRILGNVKIGKNSILGPNTVITKDIPDCSVVVGVPGRIINKITKENFDKYIGYGIQI